jgi:hypothetical protein
MTKIADIYRGVRRGDMAYIVVDCASCDGGYQVAPIRPDEDCCEVARRYGGICHHNMTTREGCVRYLDRLAKHHSMSLSNMVFHGGIGFRCEVVRPLPG